MNQLALPQIEALQKRVSYWFILQISKEQILNNSNVVWFPNEEVVRQPTTNVLRHSAFMYRSISVVTSIPNLIIQIWYSWPWPKRAQPNYVWTIISRLINGNVLVFCPVAPNGTWLTSNDLEAVCMHTQQELHYYSKCYKLSPSQLEVFPPVWGWFHPWPNIEKENEEEPKPSCCGSPRILCIEKRSQPTLVFLSQCFC